MSWEYRDACAGCVSMTMTGQPSIRNRIETKRNAVRIEARQERASHPECADRRSCNPLVHVTDVIYYYPSCR